MLELGTIIKSDEKTATVRIERNSACGSCGKCGMGKNQLHADFTTINSCDAKVGDIVQIEIKEANTLKLSLFAYVLPLVLAVGLFFLGYALSLPDYVNGLMFLGGLVLAFFLAWFVDKKKNHKWTASPEIIRIVKRANVEIEKKEEN